MTTSDTPTDPLADLRARISKLGLKASRQREAIAEMFFKSEGHPTVEELLESVRAKDEKVGQATVYRTMKLLTDIGLAHAHNFGDGSTRYEPIVEDSQHHDHIVCQECGRILEFMEPEIEKLQDEVAKKFGFRLSAHKMELYGVCEEKHDTGICRYDAGNDQP